MTVIVQKLNDDNEFEQIGRVENGDIVSGEERLTAIDSRDVWENMSEERLADRFSGPRVVAGIEPDADSDVDTESDTTAAAHDVTVSEGDTYRDELNNGTIDVVDITDGVATVESGDGEATWRERVADIRNKLATGDFTRLERAAGSIAGKASTDAVTTKAEFTAGDAVRWTWNGESVHGRVAEKRPEQATVSGNTITGDEGEPVYVIDEWDDRVGAFRRENVAKPESSLDESRKDLPDRTDDNYVSSEAWEALTTTVSASDFTTRELDYAVTAFDGVLMKGAPNEWVVPSEDPVVYRYDIPEMYLRDREPSFFVPDAGMAEAARKVREWADEHPDEFAAGGDDGELLRRAAQIVEHHDRGEPLAIEYWREIENFHNRKHAQDAHELAAEYEGEPWRDNGYAGHEGWGGDAGYEQAQRVMDHVEAVESEAAVELRGAVATEQSLGPETITKAESNEVDLDALDGDLREAVEADNYYIYGKASIEQWDDDHPPTFIQMDALEAALDRYFDSETAPGIISRHHQDIPVGKPVRSFEFDEPTTLEIDGEHYEFAGGDTARSHVEDADGDGRPELWLAANIDGETEMGKKTRVLAAQGDLNGFSVTVHRNRDEMTQEGRIVTDCDLHAVTIGTDDQIKNPGSEFDVAGFKGKVQQVADRVRSFISRKSTTAKATQTSAVSSKALSPVAETTPLSDLPIDRKGMHQVAMSYEEWVAYTGPQGGDGWRNTNTNEVVYDDDPPGEVLDVPGRDTTLDDSISPDMQRDPLTEEDLDAPADESLPDIDTSEATPEEFSDSVSTLIESDPEMGAFLSEHPPEELEDHTLITTDNGQGGVAISPSGDIQNLHTTPDSPSGTGEKLLRDAIEAGGRTLDNYDTFLTQLYARNGFQETARMQFNAEYAPEEWDFDNYGHPDVVFMHYDPEEDYERSEDYISADEWGETKQESLAEATDIEREGHIMVTTMADDANAAGYSEHEDIQRMIDQEIERNGEEYVANNIDQLLAGLGPIMSVPDKSELDIPKPSDS